MPAGCPPGLEQYFLQFFKLTLQLIVVASASECFRYGRVDVVERFLGDGRDVLT
jgi:hypothetical protein